MNIETLKQLLDKWGSTELSKNELIELEKNAKKLLSAVKMNIMLNDKATIHN